MKLRRVLQCVFSLGNRGSSLETRVSRHTISAGLISGVNDKQLFSAREECLGYLTLEVSVSSILIMPLKVSNMPNVAGATLKREPRCCPCFCLYQWPS